MALYGGFFYFSPYCGSGIVPGSRRNVTVPSCRHFPVKEQRSTGEAAAYGQRRHVTQRRKRKCSQSSCWWFFLTQYNSSVCHEQMQIRVEGTCKANECKMQKSVSRAFSRSWVCEQDWLTQDRLMWVLPRHNHSLSCGHCS